jgi:hypothetical protein
MEGTVMPKMTHRIASGLLSAAATAGLATGAVTVATAAPASAAQASAGVSAGMPRYYVISSHSQADPLQVRSSVTGRVVDTVTPPAACDPKGIRVAAAGDDRTFVVGCDTPQSKSEANGFWRLKISSRGQASALAPLAIKTPDHATLNDLALTPDGRQLAIGMQGPGGVPGGPGRIEVATLATGRVKTWTGEAPFDLSWGNHGRELGFMLTAGLYALNPNASHGGKLSSAHLVLGRTAGSEGVDVAELSPDGATIFASVNSSHLTGPLHRGSVVGGVAEISARTGKIERMLATEHAHYSADGGGSEAGWYETTCTLGPVDVTGQHLLVGCDQFGRVDRTRFTPLPGVDQDTYFSAAW